LAEFLPFIGTRYSKEKVKLSAVMSPPYDVISEKYRDELYARADHNVIRLELSRELDPYASAKDHLDRWLQEGVLVRDEKSRFYVYYQTFNDPDGRQYTRQGVIGRLKVSPYSEKQVLPHERTLAGPKRDRLALMEATHANLSPIFGLVDDETMFFDQTLEIATTNAPLVDVDEHLESGGTVRHMMWSLDDAMAVDRISTMIRNKPVVIADGHHRYETSVAFSELHPDVPGAQYIMIFLSNLRSSGTVILPTHRVLYGMQSFNPYDFFSNLKERFELQQFDRREDAYDALMHDQRSVTMIELAESPHYTLIRNRDHAFTSALDELPVMQLQERILKQAAGLTQEAIDNKTNLLYPHSVQERDQMVSERADINATFYLRPVTPQEMARVVDEGNYMPQKSTYFYPKLLTGLVFHEFKIQGR
jgi:uncharacterized protein (DUF1015 family)